jgi:hypothetical protein
MMSSNLFINHALRGMHLSYKVLGRTLTNFLINSTAGTIFTSGETVSTLVADIKNLEARGILGVANYVVEGLHEMDDAVIQKVYEDLIDSVKVLTAGGQEGHLAIKLTSMITIGIMTRISKAQGVYLEDILQVWGPEEISKEDIRIGLEKQNIKFTEDDLNKVV